MAKLKEDILMDVRPRDLLKKLSLQEQKVELDIQVPDNFYQTMLEQLLERDYLNYTSEKNISAGDLQAGEEDPLASDHPAAHSSIIFILNLCKKFVLLH